ncbi:MAG: hypothetical protein QM578_10005 [Pantoea sp.]|uniref:GT99 family glycosyltransferase N-terminal domain-containing protein n=1 Tax=Pantoea sp. TaxID=69393 RepID=UPI0039E69998
MKKILFYVEPHPIRNYFNEFMQPGLFFFEIASQNNFLIQDWKIFSNSFVLDEMLDMLLDPEGVAQSNPDFPIGKRDSIQERFIYPDEEDESTIRSLLKEWDENEILVRNNLVLGKGELSEYYESILNKIFQTYKFTHLVLWSENGAVRNFCQKNGISVIHMELGPTRLPFQETILIDPSGTNANASFCMTKYENLKGPIDSTLWMTDFSKKNNINVHELYLSLSSAVDVENKSGATSIVTEREFLESKKTSLTDPLLKFLDNYVIVSLQLTDDLNTINHSDFRTPKEFLEYVCPRLLSLGYNILIKRHPGSPSRVFNLIKEVEAIEYAKNLSENIYILPMHMEQKDFLLLSKNSRALLSINSSVCFESWIIGVPGLILGDAVFDVGGSIRTLSDDFINGGALLADLTYVNKIKESISYSLNHYFIPRSSFVISEVLSRIVLSFNAKKNDDFVKWMHDEVDIFDILLNEKIKGVEKNLSNKPDIDFYKEIKNSSENNGYYHFNIDEFHLRNNEFILRGWAIAEKTEALVIFSELNGEIIFSEMVERADVKKHFPFAALNSGFDMRVQIKDKMRLVTGGRLFIYGSDKKCRYLEISM